MLSPAGFSMDFFGHLFGEDSGSLPAVCQPPTTIFAEPVPTEASPSQTQPTRCKRERGLITQPDIEEKQRKTAERRERNRLSAKASRLKTKEHICSLEEEIKKLREENQVLQQAVAELQKANSDLKIENQFLDSLIHEPQPILPEFELSLRTSGPGQFLLSYSSENSERLSFS